jgi:hypothetical protein
LQAQRLDDESEKFRSDPSILRRAFATIEHRLEYSPLTLQAAGDLYVERFRLGGECGIQSSGVSGEAPHFANVIHEGDDGLGLRAHGIHCRVAIVGNIFTHSRTGICGSAAADASNRMFRIAAFASSRIRRCKAGLRAVFALITAPWLK